MIRVRVKTEEPVSYFVMIEKQDDKYFYSIPAEAGFFKFLGLASDGSHDSEHYGEVIALEDLPNRIADKIFELKNE